MYVAIEGMDGAGTTTFTNVLSTHYRARGKNVLTVREPTDGPIGKLIRKHLAGKKNSQITDIRALAKLFAADRLILTNHIRAQNTVVDMIFSDRCYLSSFVYQGIGMKEELISLENSNIEIKPDLILFLDVDPDECLNRIVERDGLDEKDAEMLYPYLKDLYSLYLSYCERGTVFGAPIEKIPEDTFSTVFDNCIATILLASTRA